MLEIKQIDVFYGDVQVIWDVSFDVKQGEIVALIGANGAGKSTILKTISGILRPRKGEILFEKNPIYKIDPYKLVEFGIVHIPEGRRLFAEMTVLRNLEMGAYLRKDQGQVRRDLEKIFELFPRLKERGKNMASTLSGGEQQMLAVARSLMANPKLLMLDEPSFGLAPLVKQLITEILKEIQKKGITILLSEQDALLALNTAERICVLENGRIAIEGSREDLMTNSHVKEAYLGLA